MSAADEQRLVEYANRALHGESDLERKLAASVLLHAALKALREVESLKARRLYLVEEEAP